MPPLRIAAIEFLNAAPLMWGLDADPRFSLFHTLPADCAEALGGGAAELGVIPIIELARIPGLVGLPGIGVAAGADAEVRSILLVSRCPPARIRTVALDRASRTSAALARILLRHRFGARFETRPGDGDWRRGVEAADAALVIGDPALRLRVSGAASAEGYHVFDLAREWWEWTGLPFVFALWGVRAEVLDAHHSWLAPRLRQSLQEGLAHREDLVRRWAPRLELAPGEVRRYLADNVVYQLSPAHRDSMRRFFALAAADGIVATPHLPRIHGWTGDGWTGEGAA